MATHTIHVCGWQPARLNQWDGRHWSVRARAKLLDRGMIAANATHLPPAVTKRRVSLTIILGPRQRGADPDAYWKSTLDALVHARKLVDDSPKWVELGSVEYKRGPVRATEITLEDV